MARFITNCRRTKEMDALLTLKLENGKSLKDYSTRFWEIYNDIDNCSENVAVRTFKSGLPLGTGLRQSLTKRLATTLRKLMDRLNSLSGLRRMGETSPPYKRWPLPKPQVRSPQSDLLFQLRLFQVHRTSWPPLFMRSRQFLRN